MATPILGFSFKNKNKWIFLGAFSLRSVQVTFPKIVVNLSRTNKKLHWFFWYFDPCYIRMIGNLYYSFLYLYMLLSYYFFFMCLEKGYLLRITNTKRGFSNLASKPINIRWIRTILKNHVKYRITDIFPRLLK